MRSSCPCCCTQLLVQWRIVPHEEETPASTRTMPKNACHMPRPACCSRVRVNQPFSGALPMLCAGRRARQVSQLPHAAGDVWPAAEGGGPGGSLPPHSFTVYFKEGGELCRGGQGSAAGRAAPQCLAWRRTTNAPPPPRHHQRTTTNAPPPPHHHQRTTTVAPDALGPPCCTRPCGRAT